MDKIAVLIPCYNEEKTIATVIEDFKEHLPDAIIYVYDNNSTDKTSEIASSYDGVIVRKETKQGKGNVIRSMFRDIDAECYVMVDGDDTYPAKYAQEMVDQVLINHNDLIIGDRLSTTYFTENKRPFHNFGNIIVRKLINGLFKSNIQDIMTGYRAFSFRFVKTFPVLSKGFEIETEMTIHTLDKNLYIETVAVDYRDRPDGSESKLNTYSDGLKVLRTIFRLFKNYKPFLFFTTISLIVFAISMAFILPVVLEFYKTGFVPRLPTFLLGVTLTLISLMLFMCGIILDNLSQKEKREFELRLDQNKYQFDKLKREQGLNE